MTGPDRRGSRPHVWPCRHCDMVDDYRLNRQAQIQLAEGVFRQDEDYRLATFKDWLRTFEWPRDDHAAATADPPADEVAEQRREQLTRWHHEGYADGGHFDGEAVAS